MRYVFPLVAVLAFLTGCPHHGHLKKHKHKEHHEHLKKDKHKKHDDHLEKDKHKKHHDMALDSYVRPEDSVCGKTIDMTIGQNMMEVSGTGYYFFCSQECLEQFKAAPRQYLTWDR